MAKVKKKLHYFYIFTSDHFCGDHYRKVRKIIQEKFGLKCQSTYLGSHGYRYANFMTFTESKIKDIEKIIKEKKLRVALQIEDSR